jgi:hypothetical protein
MEITDPMSPTAAERRQWWLFCYAFNSMKKAIKCCQLIENLCTDNKDTIFEPLVVAIHTYYARPFKKSRGVDRLSDDIVPIDRKGIHDVLVDFRDSVFSHTDANLNTVAQRPMHDVVYSVVKGQGVYTTSAPHLAIETYRDVGHHCAVMSKIFHSKITEFELRFSILIPSCEGHFLMNLDDSLDLFTPHILPSQGTLHYP